MDAGLQLLPVLDAMRKHGLEGILIGNAAAALHGAPVTTVDFDFMFRDTPRNLQKLKAVSRELRAVVMRPCHPVSKLYRIVNDDSGLQADFMPVIHGVKSFASLRSRAVKMRLGEREVTVASLHDIISSKEGAARSRDLAVLPAIKQTLHEQAQAAEAKNKTKAPPRRNARRPS